MNRASHWRQYVILAFILLVAAAFRFYGLAWDSGYLFHPDERKIVLVASTLQFPSSLSEFLAPASPLNPKFFAYGSFPIYLLRILSPLAPTTGYSVPLRDDSFVNLGLLGRALSGLFDLGTILLTFLLARRLYDARVGLMAAACIAVTVLHIQLAHYYAVDTLLTFLVVATMFLAARYAADGERRDLIGMGVLFGLGLATKVTAAPLIVPIAFAIIHARGAGRARILREYASSLWSVRRPLAQTIAVALFVFIITQPYALLDPIQYFGQVGTEALVARGWLDFPYTRQYVNTLPYLYPIAQSSIWGMGLPLGVFAWAGSALFVWQWWRGRKSTQAWRDGLVLSWALVYFTSVGAQHAKYLRYLLPLLPFLFLMATVAGSRIKYSVLHLAPRVFRFTFYALLFTSLLYALAFSSIYSREHPWLEISRWIYENVPAGAVLATEHWDDTLPVQMRASPTERFPSEYSIQTMPMYDADDERKIDALVDVLASSDYIVLASHRLYATIPRLPARYPISARYYRLLFDGQLGFDLAAYARNEPMLGNFTIANDTFAEAALRVPTAIAADAGLTTLDWGKADESFVVYDHPLPLVFKKVRSRSPEQLRALLTSP